MAGAGNEAAADPRTEDAKRLWRAADLDRGRLPAADWAGYQRDDKARARVLGAVARYGVALLRGVPASDGMVLEVAATFGYVRETNYGRLFDVRVVPDPANLVDGFAVAATLRAAGPEAFGVLTGTPVPFGYIDKETELTARRPVISLSPRGRIAGIRCNERSMRPPPEEAFFPALRAWAELLARPEFTLRLSPGDCLIMDNTRVLHARTAFAAASSGLGERHLQGCYADLDGLLSTLAVLSRPQ